MVNKGKPKSIIIITISSLKIRTMIIVQLFFSILNVLLVPHKVYPLQT